jgi:hypothetical protein
VYYVNLTVSCHRDITCEILQWNKCGYEMGTAGSILNTDDEVNIAQWHSVPGTGIVYGTKRGIVKVCLQADNPNGIINIFGTAGNCSTSGGSIIQR